MFNGELEETIERISGNSKEKTIEKQNKRIKTKISNKGSV